MLFTTIEIAEAVGGTHVGPESDCDGVSIDTRSIRPGQLFVPIVDARDGHDFIPAALDAGCGAYLTEHEPQGGTAIVVENTATALTRLAHHARQNFLPATKFVGITGSVGKTSVKDLTLAAVSSAKKAHANEKSFNNELGVPLTLLNAPSDVDVVIIEMGARGSGHIAELCDIAMPDVGIVTYVGAVHTSEFGSVEAVAMAKEELIQCLSKDGLAILNSDCAPVLAMAERSIAPVVTYGRDGEISARNISLDDELRPSFTLITPGTELAVTLPVHGTHQVSNSLAAVAACQAVGVSAEDAVAGLANAGLSPWRMELGRTATGALIINDAYNANAISTAAALESLAAVDADRRVAVLGLMAELGDRHDRDHQEMAALCRSLAIELIAYQEEAYGIEPVATFDEALDRIGPLTERDALLVKGSRVAQLETLAARLLEL